MKIWGVHWRTLLGGALIYVGLMGAMFKGIDAIMPKTEYRLVAPAEAMRMVNEDGWRVSERIRMTDQAVYLYRTKRE